MPLPAPTCHLWLRLSHCVIRCGKRRKTREKNSAVIQCGDSLPTCCNSKPLTNQSTLEDASWCFLDGLFNRKVFNDNDRFLTYPGPMALSLHPGVPVDFQNRNRPVITNWIHLSIYDLKSSTVRFRRLTETSPTLPCSYKHVSFTFLSIAKSSTDSRL